MQRFNDDKKGNRVFVFPETGDDGAAQLLFCVMIALSEAVQFPCSICIPCPLVTPWNAAGTWD